MTLLYYQARNSSLRKKNEETLWPYSLCHSERHRRQYFALRGKKMQRYLTVAVLVIQSEQQLLIGASYQKDYITFLMGL